MASAPGARPETAAVLKTELARAWEASGLAAAEAAAVARFAARVSGAGEDRGTGAASAPGDRGRAAVGADDAALDVATAAVLAALEDVGSPRAAAHARSVRDDELEVETADVLALLARPDSEAERATDVRADPARGPLLYEAAPRVAAGRAGGKRQTATDDDDEPTNVRTVPAEAAPAARPGVDGPRGDHASASPLAAEPGAGAMAPRLDTMGDEATAVEAPEPTERDPVSALIVARAPARGALGKSRAGIDEFEDDGDTYLPPPQTHTDADIDEESRLPTASFKAVEELGRGLPPVAELGARSAAERDPPVAVRPSAPARPSIDAATSARGALHAVAERPTEPPAKRPRLTTEPVAVTVKHGGGVIWLLTAVVAIAGSVVVLATQTDLFFSDRRAANARAAEAELVRRQREAEAAAVKAGDLAIDSEPAGAAVWLFIGRTPVVSTELSASVVHQIRVEHEGYAPHDVDVVAALWTGPDGARTATVKVELEPGAAARGAAPPAPAAETTGLSGRGGIAIDSSPPGAAAYLLIGFTPDVVFRGVEVGKAYELKVVREGYAPGYVVVREGDWWEPGGGLMRRLERRASLVRLPKEK
jgi:hypothetical protein